ncbi:hypothetical protein PIB30_078205 [Stylosanthes scabra]|uniref:Putative plant transposon protein domain-containing protein n=1 Tax=Stylosanthes scabra TaxID=79078 RepID=A0ABU6YRK1_9FABA|nr:hypothetical protein [Stylosanthes scabra]
MIKEFFANAARTQGEHHPLTSFVRGVKVDFSPANIKRVMRFKDDTPGIEMDYNTRLYANQLLDDVLRDLCIPRATWKLGTGQPPQPIQLRRKELQPLARGWLELIIHNIQPSSNRSEVTVSRAILIHSILKGEDVRIEELISTRITNIAQNLNLKVKLGFPSLICKLCKDAGVPFEEYKGTQNIDKENSITAKINPVDNETLKDVAKMTFQQREELKQIRKQMMEWTMYSSVRECYDVWAHQQANPNLVSMPLHDLTKMVYDNLEHKRPIFQGALKTDPNPGHVDRPKPIPPEDLHLYNNQQVAFFEQFFEPNK